RTHREQVVSERFPRTVALACELEAAQRPSEVVVVRRAPRDEGAERAQLVLLLGGDDEHPVRASARAERQRTPRTGADARPRERSERDPAVAEQTQRREQVLEHGTTAGERACRLVLIRRVDDDQRRLLTLGGERRSDAVGKLWEVVGARDAKALCQLQLGRGERHAVQRRDERDLAGARERRLREPLERAARALGNQFEVTLLVEDVFEQCLDRGTRTSTPL